METNNALKEWKKNVKDWGYNFNIKKDEWKLSISRDRRSFISQAKEHLGYLLITHHSRGYKTHLFDSTEAFGFILKYWEICAKEHGFLGVFIGSTGDVVKNAAKYTSYKTVEKIIKTRSEKQQAILEKYKKYYCNFNDTHLLPLNGDRINFIIDSSTELLSFLHDTRSQDDILTFDLTWSSVFPINFFTSIKLYYNGAKKYIDFIMNETHITCQIRDEKTDKKVEFLFQTAEELKEKITQEFLKMKQQQKIRNLYNPPKKIFDQKMRYNLDLSTEEGNLFYEKLKDYYEPLQIEKKMCGNAKVEKIFSYKVDKTFEEIKIFDIMTHVFVFNEKTKKIIEATDYQEGFEIMQKVIMESYQKYVTSKLDPEKKRLS